MKEFTVPMALVDYIPVALFFLSMAILHKDLVKKKKTVGDYLFIAGYLLVTAAGFFKATYKLLYALKIADVNWMNNQFFMNQGIGFLLTGIGLTLCVSTAGKGKTYAFLPTMAIVGMMVIGTCAMDASLSYISSRMKKKNAMVCFIISFFFTMAMGYLSSRDFTKASMNWIAQGVNVVAQGLLYLGTRILDQAGLKQYRS